MRAVIIGGGYVGLVSRACCAEFGCDVVVVDADPRKVETVKGGRIPFYEGELVGR